MRSAKMLRSGTYGIVADGEQTARAIDKRINYLQPLER